MPTFCPARTILTGLALVAVGGCSTDADGASAKRESLSYFIEVPADAIALTHGGGAIAPFPEGIMSSQDTPVASSLALLTRVRDDKGQLVGLASELEDFPAGKTLGGETVWDTYWTVMIKGRGTLLLHEKESLGPTVGRIFADAVRKGQAWSGSHTESSTVGPLPGRNGEIVGGTGEFAGARGSFQEIGTLRSFSPKGELAATIELRVVFDAEAGR